MDNDYPFNVERPTGYPSNQKIRAAEIGVGDNLYTIKGWQQVTGILPHPASDKLRFLLVNGFGGKILVTRYTTIYREKKLAGGL